MSRHPGAPNNYQQAWGRYCRGEPAPEPAPELPREHVLRPCATPGCLRTVPSTRDRCLGCYQGRPLFKARD